MVASQDECRSFCEQNASCNAALFDSNSSSCALFPTLYTVALPSQGIATAHVMFLKITSASSNRSSRTSITIIPRHIRMKAQERFLQEISKQPPRYSYKELQAATNDFSKRLVAALPTPTPSVLQTLAPFLPLPNPGRQTKPEYHRELMNTHSTSNHCNAKHNWWCEDMSSLSMYMMERVVMALQSHCIDNKHISKVLLRVSITMVASCSCRQQIDQMIGLAKLQGESGHNGNLDPVEELELKHGYGGAIKSAPIRVVGMLIDKYLAEGHT
ncbi:hypothetical protein GOP47_0008559 [Adiantum capillus-veneris]|uniref:Apple domain-containing protein n=1 Tax=Adiantum capillus-veneris TaxID=13818 RepID=A0A9D4ZIB0_ADICA|nr:hypothetical protein GOP47_0008559 [Adiantum capillus-veneris]